MPTSELLGKKILIVEDEVLIAMDIESILRDAGAIVVGPCTSVSEALETLRTTPVFAASLDVKLGYETSEQVACELTDCGTPFMFYSGQTLPDSMRMRWPNSVLLSKPASAAQFIASLTAVACKT